MPGNEERTAKGAAKVVVAHNGTCYRLILVVGNIRIHGVIAEKLACISVKIPGSGARYDVDLAASRAAVLRTVAAALDLELADSVHTRINQQCEIRAVVQIVGAVDRPVVLGIAGAVDREADYVDRAGIVGGSYVKLIGRVAAHARLQCEQLLVVV